jgi:hypothetical protein
MLVIIVLSHLIRKEFQLNYYLCYIQIYVSINRRTNWGRGFFPSLIYTTAPVNVYLEYETAKISIFIWSTEILSDLGMVLFCTDTTDNMRAVWKVRGLTLLIWVETLWRCGDGLFFEVPPLASDALLTTLHPLLENMLQTASRKIQENSGTGGFLTLELRFHGWKRREIAWGEIWSL